MWTSPFLVPRKTLLFWISLCMHINYSLWGIPTIKAKLLPWLTLKILSFEAEYTQLLKESYETFTTLSLWALTQTTSSYPFYVIKITSITPSSSPTMILFEAGSKNTQRTSLGYPFDHFLINLDDPSSVCHA